MDLVFPTDNVLLQTATGQFDAFAYLSEVKNNMFNITYDYDQFNSSGPVSATETDNLGIIVTADVHVNVFGIKADLGTTDGFMSLPLLTTSTEFFLAGWP